MHIRYDTLTIRILLIMLLGAAIIGLDVSLVSAYLNKPEQDAFSWIAIVIVVVSGLVIVAYIISRQLIKPLKQLSLSAQRFSVDMNCDALAIQGPKEVREAAESFNLMQRRIQQFVEERMQLIAAISHDLRTPLTRLRLRIDSLPESERKKALTDIDEMKQMIESTLSFIRDDVATEQIIAVDLVSLLTTICNEVTDITGPATFIGEDNCIIGGKPSALKRALSNLVENGVKYGERVTVNLNCSDDLINIHIKDEGPGIEENELANVFLPFYRIEKSRNRETGGVGLGLSVSQTIIRSLGGDILLQNIPGKGMETIVTLPAINATDVK